MCGKVGVEEVGHVGKRTELAGKDRSYFVAGTDTDRPARASSAMTLSPIPAVNLAASFRSAFD